MSGGPFPSVSGPKLRQFLDIQTFEFQGQHYFVLRDPLAIASQPAVVPAFFGSLLLSATGANSLSEIERIGAEQGIPQEMVQKLFGELDEFCLLENERYSLEYQRVLERYRRSPIRPSAFAGAVYSKEPEKLRVEIQSYIDGAEKNYPPPRSRNVRAVMSPHIDYHRGHETYGATFQYLKEVERPDVIVLIGTCHKPSQSRFILSTKDFEIPLGTFTNCRELTDKLLALGDSERLLGEEILHKSEHSLELQLPFLASIFESKMPEIVPILVGSFYDAIADRRPPREIPEIRDFTSALTDVCMSAIRAGTKIWLFGGVDMAHVGLNFGDTKAVAPAELGEIERRDHELLQTLLANDPDQLFLHIAHDADRRRICGFPSLYVMLDAMKQFGERYNTSLIDYRQAVDIVSDTTVTFAGMAWEVLSGSAT